MIFVNMRNLRQFRENLISCLLLLSVSTNIKYTPAIVGRIFGHSHCRLQGRLLCTLAPRQDTGVDAAWSEVQFCSRKLHLQQYPDIPISAGLLWNGPFQS